MNLHQVLLRSRQELHGNDRNDTEGLRGQKYGHNTNGRPPVDSDPRSGRPSMTTTPENIERVRLATKGDRRLTVRELENDPGIPKTTVWGIKSKILEMTRVCAVTAFFTMIMCQRIHRTLCSNFWRNIRLYSFASLRRVKT